MRNLRKMAGAVAAAAALTMCFQVTAFAAPSYEEYAWKDDSLNTGVVSDYGDAMVSAVVTNGRVYDAVQKLMPECKKSTMYDYMLMDSQIRMPDYAYGNICINMALPEGYSENAVVYTLTSKGTLQKVDTVIDQGRLFFISYGSVFVVAES